MRGPLTEAERRRREAVVVRIRVRILADIEGRYGSLDRAGWDSGVWLPGNNSDQVRRLSDVVLVLAQDAADRGYIPEAFIHDIVLGVAAEGLYRRDSSGRGASIQWLRDQLADDDTFDAEDLDVMAAVVMATVRDRHGNFIGIGGHGADAEGVSRLLAVDAECVALALPTGILDEIMRFAEKTADEAGIDPSGPEALWELPYDRAELRRFLTELRARLSAANESVTFPPEDFGEAVAANLAAVDELRHRLVINLLRMSTAQAFMLLAAEAAYYSQYDELPGSGAPSGDAADSGSGVRDDAEPEADEAVIPLASRGVSGTGPQEGAGSVALESGQQLARTASQLVESYLVGVVHHRPPGQRLPAVRDVADLFGTSPRVVRGVYEWLRDSGLVVARRGYGAGWFSSAARPLPTELIAVVADVQAQVAARGIGDRLDLTEVIAARHAVDVGVVRDALRWVRDNEHTVVSRTRAGWVKVADAPAPWAAAVLDPPQFSAQVRAVIDALRMRRREAGLPPASTADLLVIALEAVIGDDEFARGTRLPRLDVLGELLDVPVGELADAVRILVARAVLDAWGEGLPVTVFGGHELHVVPRDIAYAWAARLGHGGEWHEGRPLPGTAAQADEFGTTLDVVRQGMRILQTWGYIERQGANFLVAAGAHPLAPVAAWEDATAQAWPEGGPEVLVVLPAVLRRALVGLIPADVDEETARLVEADSGASQSGWEAQLRDAVQACRDAGVSLRLLRSLIREQLELERIRGHAALARRWRQILEFLAPAGALRGLNAETDENEPGSWDIAVELTPELARLATGTEIDINVLRRRFGASRRMVLRALAILAAEDRVVLYGSSQQRPRVWNGPGPKPAPTMLCEVVAQRLAERIRQDPDHYGPGTQLATRGELAVEFECSRPTIDDALLMLMAQGVVELPGRRMPAVVAGGDARVAPVRIASVLRAQFADEEAFPAGTSVGGRTELAERFAVNVSTIQAALNILYWAGVIDRHDTRRPATVAAQPWRPRGGGPSGGGPGNSGGSGGPGGVGSSDRGVGRGRAGRGGGPVPGGSDRADVQTALQVPSAPTGSAAPVVASSGSGPEVLGLTDPVAPGLDVPRPAGAAPNAAAPVSAVAVQAERPDAVAERPAAAAERPAAAAERPAAAAERVAAAVPTAAVAAPGPAGAPVRAAPGPSPAALAASFPAAAPAPVAPVGPALAAPAAHVAVPAAEAGAQLAPTPGARTASTQSVSSADPAAAPASAPPSPASTPVAPSVAPSPASASTGEGSGPRWPQTGWQEGSSSAVSRAAEAARGTVAHGAVGQAPAPAQVGLPAASRARASGAAGSDRPVWPVGWDAAAAGQGSGPSERRPAAADGSSAPGSVWPNVGWDPPREEGLSAPGPADSHAAKSPAPAVPAASAAGSPSPAPAAPAPAPVAPAPPQTPAPGR